MRAQSVASDVESDIEKGSAEGANIPITSTSPGPFLGGSTEPSTDAPIDAPKPRIPKVTSDSFISELVSDRGQGKTVKDGESAASDVLVEESIAEEGEEKLPGGGATLSPSQGGGASHSQWSNVDLEEAQIQQAQTGAGLDSADTCSLSSVATYSLAVEDPYGADEHPLWAWVSGGGCSVDTYSQLSWFNCSINTCE